jgi:hypothetical protein
MANKRALQAEEQRVFSEAVLEVYSGGAAAFRGLVRAIGLLDRQKARNPDVLSTAMTQVLCRTMISAGRYLEFAHDMALFLAQEKGATRTDYRLAFDSSTLLGLEDLAAHYGELLERTVQTEEESWAEERALRFLRRRTELDLRGASAAGKASQATSARSGAKKGRRGPTSG